MKALGDYLERTKTTQAAFAERIGVTQPTVANLVNGIHSASKDVLRRIVSETGLTFDDLLASDDQRDSHVSLASSNNPSRRSKVSKSKKQKQSRHDITPAESRVRKSPARTQGIA